MPSRFPEPSALDGAASGVGDLLDRAAARMSRYLNAQYRGSGGSSSPAVVTITRREVEAFWEVLWEVAAGVLFARVPEARNYCSADNGRLGGSACAPAADLGSNHNNNPAMSTVLGELRPSSSAIRPQTSSSSSFNATTHNTTADASGGSRQPPPWTRIVLIPKTLAVLCRARNGHQPQQQQRPPLPRGAVDEVTSSCGWVCVGDISKEFTTHFSIPHRPSLAQHISLHEQRSVDVPMREVARLLSDALMNATAKARRRPVGDDNHIAAEEMMAVPRVALSVDDVIAFGRIVAESIGEAARHGLTSRVPTSSSSSKPSATAAGGFYRLPCGVFGTLRMANGALEFVPHHPPQRSASSWSESPASLLGVRQSFSLQQQQQQQPAALAMVASGTGSSRPPSSSGRGGTGRPLLVPMPRNDGAAVTLDAVASATPSASRPMTPSTSYIDDAPENRKYLRRLPTPAALVGEGGRNFVGSAPPAHGIHLNAHQQQYRPASSSSSSHYTAGPSASEVAAAAHPLHPGASSNRSGSPSLSGTNALSPHAAGVAHQLWRAQQRRARLDEELAEVQRALETRLGLSSPGLNGSAMFSSQHSRATASSRSSSRAQNDDASATTPDQQQPPPHRQLRSATALAYQPVASDCTRQPAPSKLEHVMALAIERHQASVKRRELEDARAAARRGHDDEAALYARVVSEVMRREQAEKTRDELLLQQRLRHNDAVLAAAAGGGPTTSAPTCIMRPVDDRPFVTPVPGGPVASVSELGSDPNARLTEKRQQKTKKAAYLKELQEQVAVKHSSRAFEVDEKRALERTLAAEDFRHSEQARDRDKAKKREMRDHYVEAWDMQRTIAVSLSPS